VVQCAARGRTNKAIASELCLSEHTVKNYLFKAFEKLGVSSRVELLFYLAIRGYSFGQPRVEQENEAGKRGRGRAGVRCGAGAGGGGGCQGRFGPAAVGWH